MNKLNNENLSDEMSYDKVKKALLEKHNTEVTV